MINNEWEDSDGDFVLVPSYDVEDGVVELMIYLDGESQSKYIFNKSSWEIFMKEVYAISLAAEMHNWGNGGYIEGIDEVASKAWDNWNKED